MEVSLTYKIISTIALIYLTFLLIGFCLLFDEKKRFPSQIHKFFDFIGKYIWRFNLGLLGMGVLYFLGYAWAILITMWF